ncbi:transcription factor bHLH168-like [Solanum dulcamara]|uniref:transcription factor bHLH168-like n=1 Tax=Solanum dulcamara TaxID=45834 RepID=UPI002484DE79|nr:transcription factor bHLH168-like [Solanum dulcamara]
MLQITLAALQIANSTVITCSSEMENRNIINASEKLDRKTQEKNRRIKMKYLCSKLFSLIPLHHYSKAMLARQDQVDQAISYIEELKERVEVLKRRKDEMVAQGTTRCTIKTPMVEVKELDSTLEVILTSGLQKNFTLQEVIKTIEDEGAQVVTANYSTIDDAILYTISTQVKITRLGVDASRVNLRLQKLVC